MSPLLIKISKDFATLWTTMMSKAAQSRLVIVICLVCAVGIAGWGFFICRDCNAQCFQNTFAISADTRTQFESTDDRFKLVFDHRLEKYRKTSDQVSGTLVNMVILVALGILLLFYRPGEIDVPFMKLKVPEGITFLFVIFGCLYLWQNFGLLMNDAITTRISLGELEKMQTTNGIKLQSLYTASSDLGDNAILDNWCGYFFDIFSQKQTVSLRTFQMLSLFQMLGLFGIFGVLFGLVYAVCFASIIELSDIVSAGRSLLLLLLLFALALMVSANVIWVNKHPYAYYFSAWYWLVAAVALWLWHWKGESITSQLRRKKDSESQK
jgi:hypothetical protein